jgi:hypothetical protein
MDDPRDVWVGVNFNTRDDRFSDEGFGGVALY